METGEPFGVLAVGRVGGIQAARFVGVAQKQQGGFLNDEAGYGLLRPDVFGGPFVGSKGVSRLIKGL